MARAPRIYQDGSKFKVIIEKHIDGVIIKKYGVFDTLTSATEWWKETNDELDREKNGTTINEIDIAYKNITMQAISWEPRVTKQGVGYGTPQWGEYEE